VIIEALLVSESLNEKPEKIEREILKMCFNGELLIPWCERIEKAKVIENQNKSNLETK